MAAKTLRRVCLTPKVSGVGGMVSFQAKLTAGLRARSIETTFDLNDASCAAVLVVGGTRQLGAIRAAKRRGIPVVQRLDGINWLHRRVRTGLRHWLRAELGNRLLVTIRNQMATRIVYQSQFVQDWWQRVYGDGPVYRIIHNGVDLQSFSPNAGEQQTDTPITILMVEGNLTGGYELGLQSAIEMVERLRKDRKVELKVAGVIAAKDKQKWDSSSQVPIHWVGVIPNEQIAMLNRSAHMLYSSDINAACPNSVIEALACGLPVLAFDTGALKELVTPQAGRVVPYGGDPWKLDPPDIEGLALGAEEILENQPSFRKNARAHAEVAFDLDTMVDAYIEALSA
jgi:glycosyltransferase involved in cell wall biosynthesis